MSHQTIAESVKITSHYIIIYYPSIQVHLEIVSDVNKSVYLKRHTHHEMSRQKTNSDIYM
jgi:hypothetical protein